MKSGLEPSCNRGIVVFTGKPACRRNPVDGAEWSGKRHDNLPSKLNSQNLAFIESVYEQYANDPSSVSDE